jgi:hypothetical protein
MRLPTREDQAVRQDRFFISFLHLSVACSVFLSTDVASDGHVIGLIYSTFVFFFFLHHLLNVHVRLVNKMGLNKKKIYKLKLGTWFVG